MTGSRKTMGGTVLRGFPPVIDRHCRTLILGSFPSEASLMRAQYYGHPQNQFWKLMGQVLDAPLVDITYPDRLKTLLAHRIGLWDVIGRCERAGSLDSAIRNAARNRFRRVTRVAKELRRVCFNGKTAAELESWFAELGYETFVLPSSSPANTVPFRTKLRSWSNALTQSQFQRSTGHRSPVTGHGLPC